MSPADALTQKHAGASQILRIEPSGRWSPLKLKELWDYRELLYFFTARDIKVRYKQTALGAAWAIIQPFTTMVVFSLFFGMLGKMKSDDLPYPIFSYCALVPWTFFATSLQQASTSVAASSGLLTKVYFPRLMIPAAPVIAGTVDFLIAFTVLLGMMFYYDITPTANIVWLPLFLALAFITSLGAGLWLAALNVNYRDVQHVMPFLIQFWMFATPIVYPASLVPPWARTFYGLNPMVGVIEGFRWALLGKGTPPGPMMAISALVSIGLLVGGTFYFRKMERTFADIV
jgi:lipopolysaccharide transport system permease protein